MGRIIKENPQVTAMTVLVIAIALLCLIFRYDGEYQAYYEITEKKESNGSTYFYIMEQDQEVELECSREIYDQLKTDSEHLYYISYKMLRFGNGSGELCEIQID